MKSDASEYYFGGGQQNGYFSHKGRKVAVENKSTWVDGGVSSPNPFYFSSKGYGVVRHTFAQGEYDFRDEETIVLSHDEKRFDAFYFVEDSSKDILSDYVELTGQPALMPKYGFYQGNANCYNKPDEGITLTTTGVEVAKSYGEHDMPIGWFLPNDGYGCGYGGIDNLKAFVEAVKPYHFVTGLWTENDLDKLAKYRDELRALEAQEVSEAGTRMIKTDVRWVGEGCSFGLNAVRQAYEGIAQNSDWRPFVVTLDGWAGTQRYAGTWSGDQTGGSFEYIRFHIPTYLGAGLSGQPNVGSDMDGIYGGSAVVSTRDYQWKSFTPIMINMSGWSDKDKTPWVWGEPYESINRMYLKLKAQMLPYYYSYARESYDTGVPMVRALMLEYPEEEFTMGNQTQYEYLWGENLLVAPVYDEAENNAEVRNKIYLPGGEDQVWIDYFTGEQYTGGKVVNSIDAPLWKLPLFVKSGAIIPMTVENNSVQELTGEEPRIFDVYPDGDSSFTLYDDGYSQAYQNGEGSFTEITSHEQDGTADITVGKMSGSFEGMKSERETQFIVHTYAKPQSVQATVGGIEAELQEAADREAFEAAEGNAYYYDEAPRNSAYYDGAGNGAPRLYVKIAATDITANEVKLHVEGIVNRVEQEIVDDTLPMAATAPQIAETSSSAITLSFDVPEGMQADLEIDGMLYENVTSPFIHDSLNPDEEHTYRLRYTNTLGSGEFSEQVSAKTDLDPYRNVISGAVATANSYEDIPGDSYPPQNLVDGDLASQWYSNWDDQKYYTEPKIIDIDLQMAYQLDKLEYINDGTSQILDHEILISKDGVHYEQVDASVWEKQYQNDYEFDGRIARYVRIISHDQRFNSGNEIRIYKVDGTDGFSEADCNGDRILNHDDLTFLKNYMGVDQNNQRLWNQVKEADFSCNGIIDAYDLMFVASRLDGGVRDPQDEVSGMISFTADKTSVKKGDTVTISVNAHDFVNVYALNFELLLDAEKLSSAVCPDNVCTADSPFTAGEFTEGMLDYSKSGETQIEGKDHVRFYGAFSFVGDNGPLQGDGVIATIELTALQDIEEIDMILNDVQVISSGGTIADASWKDDGGEEGPGTDPGEGGKPGEGEDTPKPGDDGDTGVNTQQGMMLALLAAAGASAVIAYRRRQRQ